MVKQVFLICLIVTFASCVYSDNSASDVVVDIYRSCLSQYSVNCVRPKAMSWLKAVGGQDRIRLTEDLTIIRTSEDMTSPVENQQRNANDKRAELFDKIDSFLSTHSLKIEVPQILKTEEARNFIPESYMNGGLANDLVVPLSESNSVEGNKLILF